MSAKIIFKIRNITVKKRGVLVNIEKYITMMNVYASINRALIYIKWTKFIEEMYI